LFISSCSNNSANENDKEYDPFRDGALSPEGIFGWGGYRATLFWIDPENNLIGLVPDRGSYSAREMFRKVRIAAYQAFNRI
jgi:hypothetical protein